MYASCDRKEGRFTVLIADDENEYVIPTEYLEALLGAGVQSGDVLSISVEAGAEYGISSAKIDTDETERRRAAARARLERLLKRQKNQ